MVGFASSFSSVGSTTCSITSDSDSTGVSSITSGTEGEANSALLLFLGDMKKKQPVPSIAATANSPDKVFPFLFHQLLGGGHSNRGFPHSLQTNSSRPLICCLSLALDLGQLSFIHNPYLTILYLLLVAISDLCFESLTILTLNYYLTGGIGGIPLLTGGMGGTTGANRLLNTET